MPIYNCLWINYTLSTQICLFLKIFLKTNHIDYNAYFGWLDKHIQVDVVCLTEEQVFN